MSITKYVAFGNSSSSPPRPFLQQINLNSPPGYHDDSSISPTSPPYTATPATPATPKWGVPNDTNNNRIKHLGWPEHRSGGNAISLSPIRRADVNKGVNYKYTPLRNNSSESDNSSESETEQSYANIRRTSLSPILSSKEKNDNDSSSEDSSNEDSWNEDNTIEDSSDDDTIFSSTTTVKSIKKRRSCISRLRFKRYDPSMWRIKGMGRKTQFNNERLYLHWIKFGLLQGSISLTLLNFAEGVATWIAVGTFLLALITLIYGTTLYHKRHLYLVAKRQDVEFFARTMPTILALGLILIYGANFILVMAYGDASASATPWTPRSDGNSKNHF
ncbi:vacuolar transporter chaperone [Mortierella sp. AD011]|nr:vacuolar transporter chaperone [Mortierella sp. AD010]KAF9398809.1 vacuolar transporter chaperone [Mortierella sp. AD011]